MATRLSVVVCARNDDHGGGFLHRMQVFVNTLLEQWDLCQLDAELLIVEWNPPPGPRLRDAICWPRGRSFGKVRIIEAPLHVHRRFPNSERMPLFEWIAKNAGIRRAKGEWVLATNVDIVFSSPLMETIARQPLSPGCFYRARRHHLKTALPAEAGCREIERICASDWYSVSDRHGTYKRPACQIKRRLWPFFRPHWALRRMVYPWLAGPPEWYRMSNAFGAASGDFLLMSRPAWHALRGFPELPLHSHADSLLCWIATLSLKQEILPFPIYHQDHSREGHRGRPTADYWGLWKEISMKTRRGVRSLDQLTPNGEDWGLGGLSLAEQVLSLERQ
jgi:hypothetical protein